MLKARRRSVQHARTFRPTRVPEVAAGYWWDAANTSGFGTSAFRVLEGNGRTAFDLPQATVASQPTQLTENGGMQFRMRRAADPNPCTLITAGAVAAGWTGDTYLAGWFRLPDASGDVTGADQLISHTNNAGGQRRVLLNAAAGSPDNINVTTSVDATATVSNAFTNAFAGAAWIWLEALIRVGVSVEVLANNVSLAHLTTNAPGAVLFDTSVVFGVACRAGAGLANLDTTDWSTCYYCNGIPSLPNRVRIANYHNPSGVLLSA